MHFLRIAVSALFFLVSVPFVAHAAENRCELYPIGLPQSEIASAAEGAELTLSSKVGGGHFGWLSWDGDL